jgi:hypothetical protein
MPTTYRLPGGPYHLLDDLTVYENIELPLAYRDVPKSSWRSDVWLFHALDVAEVLRPAGRTLVANE